MNVQDVMRVLDAELVCGEDSLETEVHEACGSDMMSDVLAYVKDQAVLLTGLVNIQTVRTADTPLETKALLEDMFSTTRGIILMDGDTLRLRHRI